MRGEESARKAQQQAAQQDVGAIGHEMRTGENRHAQNIIVFRHARKARASARLSARIRRESGVAKHYDALPAEPGGLRLPPRLPLIQFQAVMT